MPKTLEELEQLRTEYNYFKNKLKELSEEELNSIVGAGYSIPPIGSDAWRSWNPCIYDLNKEKDNLGLLNDLPEGDVIFEKVNFDGNVSNREDK